MKLIFLERGGEVIAMRMAMETWRRSEEQVVENYCEIKLLLPQWNDVEIFRAVYHKFFALGRNERCHANLPQVHVCNPLRKSESAQKSIFLLNGGFKSWILMSANRSHSAIKRHFPFIIFPWKNFSVFISSDFSSRVARLLLANVFFTSLKQFIFLF